MVEVERIELEMVRWTVEMVAIERMDVEMVRRRWSGGDVKVEMVGRRW